MSLLLHSQVSIPDSPSRCASQLLLFRRIVASLEEIRPEHYSLLLRLSEDDVKQRNATASQLAGLSQVEATLSHEQHDCVVCMESFEAGQTLIQLPNCGHEFHSECIMQYFGKYDSCCPLCKTAL